MIKQAIIKDTLNEAQSLCDQIDVMLGYPNYETQTMRYTIPMQHSNQTQWIVLVPDSWTTELFNITTIETDSDIYRPLENQL